MHYEGAPCTRLRLDEVPPPLRFAALQRRWGMIDNEDYFVERKSQRKHTVASPIRTVQTNSSKREYA